MTLDDLLRRTAGALVLAAALADTSAFAQGNCRTIDYVPMRGIAYAIIDGYLLAQHPDGFTVLVGATSATRVATGESVPIAPTIRGNPAPISADATWEEKLARTGLKMPLNGKIYTATCPP